MILPHDMALPIAIFLVFMSFVTSFITAAFGIGGGAIILAVLAVSVPAAALIPIHGVVQLGSNAGRVGLMLKDVVWRPVLPFIGGSVIGAGIGGALAVQIPTAIVQIAVGLFIVFVVLVKLPPIAMRYVFAGGTNDHRSNIQLFDHVLWRHWQFYRGHDQKHATRPAATCGNTFCDDDHSASDQSDCVWHYWV